MRIFPVTLSRTNQTAFRSDAGLKKSVPVADEFVKSTGSLDIARLKLLGIKHFRLIDSNSIRGVTLANQKTSLLTELKECGIRTIVDLRAEGGDDSKYAETCRENGLDYVNFKLKINMPIFNLPLSSKLSTIERQQEIDAFIKRLPDFFKIMDEGKYYMACLLGLHRTDLAVVLNYLVNPNEPKTPPILSHMYMKEESNFTNKYIGAMKNLLKNIKPEHKQYLGLPEDFNSIFDVRILKLRLMNGITK